MHTLGLLGGMSWESTATYYRLINEGVRHRLGGLHSAELVLWSVDFAGIERLQARGAWEQAGTYLGDCGKRLAAAGAKALVLCTNTMHVCADVVAQRSGLPLIHIADATAAALKHGERKRPLLLATAYTMEQDFYRGRLKKQHGLDVRIPGKDDRATVHRVIYEELCQGVVTPESKRAYQAVIDTARRDLGVDSVIFGCTEIGLLLGSEDIPLPVYDSCALHAEAAVAFALQDRRP